MGVNLHSWLEKSLFLGEPSHCSECFRAKALPLAPFSVVEPSKSVGDRAEVGRWQVTWLSSEGEMLAYNECPALVLNRRRPSDDQVRLQKQNLYFLKQDEGFRKRESKLENIFLLSVSAINMRLSLE